MCNETKEKIITSIGEDFDLVEKKIGNRFGPILVGYIFEFADHVMEDYNGGLWRSGEADNGAWYMIPPEYMGEEIHIIALGWQCYEITSSAVCGMAITIFAITKFLELLEKCNMLETEIAVKMYGNYNAIKQAAFEGDLTKEEMQSFHRIID